MLKKIALFLVAAGLQAAPITYSVFVNTSSIAGVSGNVDFQFNPGFGISDPAFVTISMFSSNGSLAGSPVVSGDATGTLPPLVTIHNTTAFNDYADGFTFGSFLSFFVRFDGAAVTAPSAAATSGSSFAFSLFNSDFSAPLLSTDTVNGVLVQGDVNLDGTVSIQNFGISGTTSADAVPEPASALLIALGLAATALVRRK
jgi:PEP-CTERM motif-containing protein